MRMIVLRRGKLSPQVRAKLAVSSSQQGENISWASMTQTEYDALSTYDSYDS